MIKNQRRVTLLIKLIEQQQKWITDHGGNLAGYVMRYGSASDPKHYGDGGEAIYAADTGALDALHDQLKSLASH